jgi:hypothetical protein
MNIKYLLAAALCALPMLAHAGIVYEWTSTNYSLPQGMTMRLEFDKKTVTSGSFNIDLAYDHGQGYGTIPKRGLLALFVTLPGVRNDIDYSSKGGRGYTFPFGYLDMNLTFTSDGFLMGSIYANDQNSHIRLTSVGRDFTVIDANSDEVVWGGCQPDEDTGRRPPCSGATGYIQRVAEVPEPGSIALLVLGAAGLVGTRRPKLVK